MSWLEQIIEELKYLDVTEMVEPEAEVDFGSEMVVGVVDDYHRRLYTYIELRRAEGEKKRLAAEQTKDKAERTELLQQAFIYAKNIEALRIIFEVSIRDAHSLWEADCVEIKKGWNIVAKPCDCPGCTGRVRVRIISLG
jgi:hypothetical protein